MSEEAFRYEELASFITDAGRRRHADARARARRRCARSAATARSAWRRRMQAYRLLEDRGVLEARPQSGFYVARARAGAKAAEALAPAGARDRGQRVRRDRRSCWSMRPIRSWCRSAARSRAPNCSAPAGSTACWRARRASKGAEYNIYTGPQGDPQLRREIARRALRWGQALSPDDVVITVGCTEALIAGAARGGAAGRHDRDRVADLLRPAAGAGGAGPEGARAADRCRRSGIDLAALQGALAEHRIAACLLSSSFNNPLGCTMPDEKKLAVLDLLARHDVPLIEDDIYGDIYFGDERPRPFIALDRRGNTIYCSSFSKTVAPGYRIGWVAAGRHLQRILDAKAAFTLCGPALPQAAFAEFLSSGGYDGHLRRIRRVFAAQHRPDDPRHRPELSRRHARQPAGRRLRAVAGAAAGGEDPRRCSARARRRASALRRARCSRPAAVTPTACG